MAATPEIGPRADGTNVWKVQVGGMDMETGTDVHSFFPKEITINAGDTIFYQFAPMGMPGAHTVTFTSGEEMPATLHAGHRRWHAGCVAGGPPSA